MDSGSKTLEILQDGGFDSQENFGKGDGMIMSMDLDVGLGDGDGEGCLDDCEVEEEKEYQQ